MPRFEEKLDFSKTKFLDELPFPSHFHSVVLPLIFEKEGVPKCLGTCFVIDPANGLVVTAKHNVDQLYPKGFSNADKISGQEFGSLGVFYSTTRKEEGNYVGGIIPVSQLNYDDLHDLAILRIAVPVDSKTQLPLLKAVPLTFEMPEKNQSCLALGYNKLEIDKSLETKSYNASFNIVASQGVIEEVHSPQRDTAFMNFPCFQFNGRVESGMSGGPIFYETKGVCGIVSSSFTVSEADEEETKHISYASLSCMLLALRFSVDLDKPNEKTTILQIIQKGVLKVDPGFENLKIEEVDNYIRVHFEEGLILAIEKGQDPPVT